MLSIELDPLQCVDPCAEAECPGNTPCLVEDHKAICKFCPSGFVVDKDYGCLESGVQPGVAPGYGNTETLTTWHYGVAIQVVPYVWLT